MFLPSSETEGAAAPAAVLPPAELLAHEEDAEVHQEDAAGDRQVSQTRQPVGTCAAVQEAQLTHIVCVVALNPNASGEMERV